VEQASAAGVLPDSAETGDASSNDSLRLLQEQAEAGDANAELALAVRYANGDGVWQSYPEALKWFTRAREEGVRVLRGPAAEAWRRVRWWAKSGHE
jgi:TPR repeat protein